MAKLQATQPWVLLAKKNCIYSAVWDELHPTCFRSPPSLATRDLALERVVLIDHPACTNKTNKKKTAEH